MIKAIIAITFIALIIIWIVWDNKASWECTLFGDCNDHWFGVSCSRCGYTKDVKDIMKLPDTCPKCGRKMRK